MIAFRSIAAYCALVQLCAISSAPARADAGISVTAGPNILLNGTARTIGGTVQPNVGLGLDFGPKTFVPIRVSLDLDYAGGSSGGGSVSTTGLGIGARLTTPLYAGLTLSLNDVNVHPQSILFPAGGSSGGGQPAATSNIGFGQSFFVGQRLFGLPGGGGVALQATYRRMPSGGGVDPSSITAGLRLSL